MLHCVVPGRRELCTNWSHDNCCFYLFFHHYEDPMCRVLHFFIPPVPVSLCRFQTGDGEVKYVREAEELIRPERNTLLVSFTDLEGFNQELATTIQEEYYRWNCCFCLITAEESHCNLVSRCTHYTVMVNRRLTYRFLCFQSLSLPLSSSAQLCSGSWKRSSQQRVLRCPWGPAHQTQVWHTAKLLLIVICCVLSKLGVFKCDLLWLFFTSCSKLSGKCIFAMISSYGQAWLTCCFL